MDPFAQLLARADSEVAGMDANRALWDARIELERQHHNVVCYEMVVDENAAWSDFLARTIPRLTEHLNAKGLPMLGGPSALLSVWHGPRMFIFSSREFFAAVRDIEALDEDSLWIRIGEWRKALGLSVPPQASRVADRSAPHASLALPAPRAREDREGSLGSADVRISEESSEIRTDE